MNIGAIIANSTAAEPRRLRRNRRHAFATNVRGCGIEETSGRESNGRNSYLKLIVEVLRTIEAERPAALGES
jgi:hypothetical protein